MKELDELREWVTYKSALSNCPEEYTLARLDVIEQAIADRYMELPVDADGEPWHIGDAVDGHGTVQSMRLDRYGWCFLGMENAINPALHRHAKPETIEDVLADFAARAEHLPRSREELLTEIRAILDEWAQKRTCRVDGSISWDWTGASTTYEHNLTCGHMITTDDPEPPNFCPECGARVVS